MKTGKSVIWVAVAALTLGLGACSRSQSVDSVSGQSGVVQLDDAQDSISFAVSMMIARDMPYAIEELDITPATLDFFVKGLCDAFPADASPEAIAYAHGVVVGASAMEMLDEANLAIFQSDTTMKIDRQMFLEGLKAMAYGDSRTMSVANAYDYYNRTVFRLPSEDFIARNSTRKGVETLPCGVQVKIEREGNGETATSGSTVSYIYKASFINGNLATSSRGQAVEAAVGSVIPGLAGVLTSLPVGTKCKAYIPWQLAYGARGSNNIPPYSALVYDIEIVKIIKK